MESRSILIAIDEGLLARELAKTLETLGYLVVGTTSSVKQAIRIIEKTTPSLILVDIDLAEDTSGIEAAAQIRSKFDVPLVYLVSHAEIDVIERAKHTNPYGYVSKPVSLVQLASTIEAALSNHKSDQKRRESETQKVRAEELAGIHSWQWDIQTGRLVWSAESYRAFGLHPEDTELTFDTFIHSVNAEDRDGVRKALRDAIDGTHPYNTEFRIVQPDGQERYLHSRGEIERDAKGHPIRMIGVALDISERKKAEDALRESELSFRELVENLNDIIFSIDCDGVIKYVSSPVERLFGYSDTELVGQKFQSLVYPADLPEIVKSFQDVLENRLYPSEFRILTKSGDCRWIRTSSRPIVKDGRTVGICGIVTDINDRKMAEEERDRILDMSQDLICIAGTDGYFKYVNPAWEDVLGYTRAHLLSKPFLEFIHPEDHQKNDEEVARLASGKPSVGFENRYISRESEIRTISWTATPLPEKGLMYCIGRDVTDRRKVADALRKSEARYKQIFESAGLFVSVYDRDGMCLMMNPTVARYFGGEPADFVGKSFYQLHPKAAEEYVRRIQDVIESGEPREYEDHVEFPSGSRWLFSEVRPVQLPKDNIHAAQILSTDITEAKRAQEALEKSEELLRATGRMAKVGGWEVDADTLDVRWTEETYRIHEVPLDYKPPIEEAINFFHEDDRPKLKKAIQDALEHGEPYDMEIRFITGKGKHLWTRTVCKPEIANGKTVRLRGTFQDITERKNAGEQLLQAERRYRRLFNDAPLMYVITHNEREEPYISDCNEKFLDCMGYSREEVLGQPLANFYTAKSRTDLLEGGGYARALAGEYFMGERELLTRNGTVIPTLLYTATEMNTAGKVIGTRAMFVDITDRKKAEKSLLESEKRYRSLFEESTAPIIETKTGGEIVDTNRAFEEFIGGNGHELVGSNILELYADPSDREDFRKVVERDGYVRDYPLKMRRKDGAELECITSASVRKSDTGEIVGYRGYFRDITEQAILERQLRESQKMEAVGTLAGGIAHDFNNLLQIITGNAELLETEFAQKNMNLPEMEAIHQAASRGADLVKKMLTFGRRVDTKFEPINLNQDIKETERLLYRTIPKMIEIELKLEDKLKPIRADSALVEQMLINLAINANDAMPEGGKLTFETQNIHLDEDHCRTHADFTPGQYVLLKVSDTGHGMDPDVIPHIFEPFFTTKGLADGTGLGLSTVFGIIKMHEGHITCDSEVGNGTTFSIYFPADNAAKLEKKEKREVVSVVGGTETILVVDDEPMIASLAKKVLEKAGYSVITKSSGQEAIELYKRNRTDISLVILDHIMPEMSGKQCLEELLKIDPQVKALIASGFAIEGETKAFLDSEAKGFVSKPFNMRGLLRSVRQVLDGA